MANPFDQKMRDILLDTDLLINALSPTIEEPELDTENYFSPSATQSRVTNLRRTQSEIRNTTRDLARMGQRQELEALDHELNKESKGRIARVFDGLQAANFAIAGGVRERQEGGTHFDVLRRFGSELAASSDIFDFFTDEEIGQFFGKDPKRETFSHVLRDATGRSGDDAGTAALGFVLDIALDPTTYMSFGFVPSLRVLSKGARTVAPFVNVFAAMGAGGKKALGSKWGQRQVTNFWKSKENKILNIPHLLGQTFSNKFRWEQAIRQADPEMQEAIGHFLTAMSKRDLEQHLGSATLMSGMKEIVEKTPEAFVDKMGFSEKSGIVRGFHESLDQGVNIKDFMTRLFSDMTQFERRMVGMFTSEGYPDELVDIIKASSPERAPFIEQKLNVLSDYFKLLRKEEEMSHGIFSSSVMKSSYDAASPASRKLANELREKIGINKADRAHVDAVIPDNLLDAEGTKNVMNLFQNLEQRVLNATPELDIVNIVAKNSYDVIRSAATKRFQDAVLSDPHIVKFARDNGNVLKIWDTDKWKVNRIKKVFGDEADNLISQREQLRKILDESGYDVYFSEGAPIVDGILGEAGKIKKGGGLFRDTKTGEIRRVFDEKSDAANAAIVQKVTGKKLGRSRGMDANAPVYRVRSGKAVGEAVPLHTIRDGSRFIVKTKAEDQIFKVSKKGKEGNVATKNFDGEGGIKYYSPSTEVRNIDHAPGFIMPKDMVEHLKNTNTLLGGGSQEVGKKWVKEWLTGYDKILSMWKGYAVFSPVFLSRNFQSNVFSNWLAGVAPNPKRYAEALRLQSGRGEDISIKVGDTVYSGGSILKLADQYNVRSSSGFQRDIGLFDVEEDLINTLAAHAGPKGDPLRQAMKNIDHPIVDIVDEAEDGVRLMERLSRWAGSGGKLLQFNRKLGSAMENNSKIVHFMHLLRKGETPEEAARSVHQFLFDYGDLTDIERRYMRRLIPFYTWMRKNVPLMLEQLVVNPERFSYVPKGITAINNLSADVNHYDVPDYFSESTAIRMPKYVDHVIKDANTAISKLLYSLGAIDERPEEITGLQPVYLKPDLPFQDLGMTATELLSSLTPVIKTPFETIIGQERGHSFFLDRPTEAFEGEDAEVNLFPGFDFRLRAKHQQALEGMVPTLGKYYRMKGAIQKGKGASQLASEFLGIKFLQNDIFQAADMKGRKRRDKLRAIKKNLQSEYKRQWLKNRRTEDE